MSSNPLAILLLLLIGLFSLTSLNNAFRRLQRRDSKKLLDQLGGLFFYRYLHLLFFPKYEYESLFFATSFTQNVVRFFYAVVATITLVQIGFIAPPFNQAQPVSWLSISWPIGILTLIGLFFLFFIIGDYLPRILANSYPKWMTRLCAIPAALLMSITFPITFLLLKLSQMVSTTLYFDLLREPHEDGKQQLIEILEESTLGNTLEPHDRKLLESVMAYRNRIAREVMVPRVNVFSLPDHASIKEVAELLLKEGYSRTPVYHSSLDNIVGVLMYKDILAKYMEYAQKGNNSKILEAPIATLIKNVIYTPETKRLSQLLQEFRKQQVHLAIVVDEYGGTEGIVTIEDILEEIVGDIADEYDEAAAPFAALPDGGWLIDARMNISDVREQLGIEIPQEGDYDTVGGYIFHETGTIPTKGFVLTRSEFELEVIRSSERSVDKVRIRMLENHHPTSKNSD